MNSPFHRLKLLRKRFFHDIRGAALIYVTATLPAVVGLGLLVIDGSRHMTLHTSLQKAVDALAIAAAAELDRLPGAMQRANLAIANIVENDQSFGQGPAAIDETNVTVRFYSALPASDSDPMPTSGATLLSEANASHDFSARFVEITVNPVSLNTIFPASFIGGANSAVARASAVAGNNQVVCGVAPLWICNPWEATSNTDIYETQSIYNGTDTRAERRRQIRMREGPGGSGYGPGNYGFLDLGSGAKALEKGLAFGTPNNCVAQTGVDFKTGQNTGPVKDGINTRFGLYSNMSNLNIDMGVEADRWKVRPARNVRMGQDQASKKLCKEYEPGSPADGMALPRDGCFTASSCERIGDGNWGETEMLAYWAANFPSNSSLPTASNVGPAIANPAYQAEGAAADWNSLTRYDIYKYEIDLNYTSEEAVGGEYGDPTTGASCFPATPPLSGDIVDRRLITGAILNCNALIADGSYGSLNGHQTNVPVAVFAQFFITEPLEKGGGGGAGDIYSELVSVILPSSQNSPARDQVQLYR